MYSDNNSLPPLPNSEKSGNQTNVTEDINIELPPLEVDQSNAEDADDVIQNHYLRVQEAVLNSADAKIKEISSKLYHTELLLKETGAEKADAGVALYRTRKEISHLNKILSKNRVEQEQNYGEKAMLTQQVEATTRALEESRNDSQNLITSMKEIQRKYDESQQKILQLRDINSNYTSEVKIQKRINSKLKKEMEVVTEKARSMEDALEQEREKTEILFTNGKTLEGLLNQQQAEVRAAKMAIETLHKENNLLEKTREATEKQWEESLTAMSGRDKAIQSMQDHKQSILTKLSESEVANRVYKTEHSSLQSRLTKKEQECEQLSHSNAHLKTELKEATTKLDDTLHYLSQSRYAEKSFSKEVEELSKTVETNEREIQSKMNLIASLKDKLKHHGMDFNETEKFKIDIEDAERREDKLQQAADEKLIKVQREGEYKNVSIRYDLATLTVELSKKESELFDLKKAYDSLKEQNQDLNKHYVTLHEAAKQMTYSLERKDHDLNLAKAKTNALEQDHKEAFGTVIAGLHTEIKNLKMEKEKLKNLWLESQKSLVGEQSKYKELWQENDILQTKLGIAEGVKQKTGTEMNIVKEESFEHKQEAAKLYNELKKMQPIIANLQEQNKIFQQKLTEAELKLEESYANHSTTKQMLRTEIRRLSQDRSHLRQEKAEYDRSVMHTERNTQLYKEMIEKLKSEKYELQKSVFDLKRRADEADKKYFDLKIRLRQMEKIESQNAEKKLAANIAKGGKWKSFTTVDSFADLPPTGNTTPGGGQQQPEDVRRGAAPAADKVFQNIPDFDTMRLRIDSLNSEKEFLMNENSLLNNKLTKLNSKFEELQTSYKVSKEQMKELTQIRAEQIEKIGTLDKRYSRAKKVAAHLEKQIKDSKPNAKIDYLIIGSVEPSTQLLASLMVKDTRPANPLSGPTEHMVMPTQLSRRDTMVASQQRTSKAIRQ